MNCSEAQSRLSAYHDGELPPELAAEVAGHVAACPSCAAELEMFRKLSSMTRRLTDPPLPAGDWEKLRTKLTPNVTSKSAFANALRRPIAVAATILVLASIGLTSYRMRQASHEQAQVVQTFGHFLERFKDQPQAAQQILLTNYQGQSTSLHDVSEALGYEPVIAKELPPGCSSHKAYLLNMPCCRCMEILCEQEDGHSIAVFEHDTRRPGWFGERNSIECSCHSVPTSVTQIGNELAATWKNGKRYLTIVGARDLEEVTRFVAFYKDVINGDG